MKRARPGQWPWTTAGPSATTADGALSEDIVESYWRHGFYVFEGVIGEEELADIERDVRSIQDRAPTEPRGKLDRLGRPALGADGKGGGLALVRPLSDPIGGTAGNNGRHPAKMIEPAVPEGAPEWVLQVVGGSLQFSDAALRLYAHPDLLRVAETFNGPDFSPFNEVIWIKQPRLGGSVAWHQDGTTHWDTAKFHKGSHGFNFMAQLYGCDATNGLWVVPGSHLAKADIKGWCAAAGSDRIPHAVPLLCAPGDVAITNRQAVHGSFANTSDACRVTINFGFHPARERGRRPRQRHPCAGERQDHLRRGPCPAPFPGAGPGDRGAESSLPGRDALRIPAVRRTVVRVERCGQGEPAGLQQAGSRHLSRRTYVESAFLGGARYMSGNWIFAPCLAISSANSLS